MRSKLCQINWHPSETLNNKNAPIRATDFAPLGANASAVAAGSRLVATAAQDGTVRMWRLCSEDAAASSASSAAPAAGATGFRVDYIIDFEGHSMCVNAVRFSPNGECLATGGDDGYVIVWYRTTRPLDPSMKPSTSWCDVTSAKQLQRVIMRGKLSEICDLAWTSDSKYVITGSVDGTIGVWDVRNAKLCQQTKDHKGFVQGVATDPLGEYVATQCSSRTVRMHRAEVSKKSGRTLLRTVDTIRSRTVGWEPIAGKNAGDAKEADVGKAVAPGGDGSAGATPTDAATAVEKSPVKTMSSHALFLDNMSTTTFFRRPTWTADGSLLIAPTGQFKAKANEKYQNTTYLFARGQWNSPVAHFPIGTGTTTVGVRCSPIMYELRQSVATGTTEKATVPAPLIILPYRMIVAVLTTNAVMVYDTQHAHMIAMVRNQHFANLTDVAWSNDGNTLFVTSSDGYCSVVEFAQGELGTPLAREAYPEAMRARVHQNWFALQEMERARQAAANAALAEAKAAEAAASDSAAVDSSSSSSSGNHKRAADASVTARDGAKGGKKKRRIMLTAVSPDEAAKGNLLDAP